MSSSTNSHRPAPVPNGFDVYAVARKMNAAIAWNEKMKTLHHVPVENAPGGIQGDAIVGGTLANPRKKK